MSYIVTSACVDCKYTSCVDVCPVEAFHETPDRLLINADDCVNCDACVPECPVEAIYAEENVPEEMQDWIEKNQDAENFPKISEAKEALKGPKCVDPNAG
ncbi:MAG: ferredoxin [Verrucomicrobiales bacterium]|nr:ferredoxin [Verrucomicrobiales bacterium]